METIQFKSGKNMTGSIVMLMSHSLLFLAEGTVYLLNRHNIEGRLAFKGNGRR